MKLTVNDEGRLDDVTVVLGDGTEATLPGDFLLFMARDIHSPHALFMVVSDPDVTKPHIVSTRVNDFPNARMVEAVLNVAERLDALSSGVLEHLAVAVNHRIKKPAKLPEATPTPRVLKFEDDE